MYIMFTATRLFQDFSQDQKRPLSLSRFQPRTSLTQPMPEINSRVLNILSKRLLTEFINPRDAGPIKDVINVVTLQSQRLPLPERLAPRPTKVGTLDLNKHLLLVITRVDSLPL